MPCTANSTLAEWEQGMQRCAPWERRLIKECLGFSVGSEPTPTPGHESDPSNWPLFVVLALVAVLVTGVIGVVVLVRCRYDYALRLHTVLERVQVWLEHGRGSDNSDLRRLTEGS